MYSMNNLKFFLVGVAAAGTLCGCSSESARAGRATDTAIAASEPRARSSTTNPVAGGDALPRGFKLEGGATVLNTDYVFRRVMTPRGDALWLDSMHRDGSRTRRAELSLPPLAADERVMLASCDANGRLDPLLVAIVFNEANVTRFTRVRQAWRANPKAQRFDIVPLAGIECEDPGS
jgi:hypothetical protein